jgi:molecular chaperone IbpA
MGRRMDVLRSSVIMNHIAQVEDVAMRTIDPAMLWRSTVGFDRVFDLLDETRRGAEETYPPYDIVRTEENRYEITLALAGFGADEVTITAEQNVLTVEGKKARREQQQYLYQGISSRPFRRSFRLADHVQVKGAAFDNGLLKIALVHEIPEAMKPRHIAINGASGRPHLEQRNAA